VIIVLGWAAAGREPDYAVCSVAGGSVVMGCVYRRRGGLELAGRGRTSSPDLSPGPSGVQSPHRTPKIAGGSRSVISVRNRQRAVRPAAAGALPGLGPRPVHRESQDHISVYEVTAAPAG
jgi:hypothetical protein